MKVQKKQFSKIMIRVSKKFDTLIESPTFDMNNMPSNLPQEGIYLFQKGGKYLYVGRSSKIKYRLRGHIANSHYSATLAFLIAREKTGKLKGSYKEEGSRTDLLRGERFRRCFDDARNDIKKMKIQVIEETDSTKQALLEIYTATVTKAKYNNFDNH